VLCRLGVIIVDEIYPKRHFFCTRPMYPYQPASRGNLKKGVINYACFFTNFGRAIGIIMECGSSASALQRVWRAAPVCRSGQGNYGVRKRSFRLMLKLRCSAPEGLARGVRCRQRAGDLWSAEAPLSPDAEAALLHSRGVGARRPLSPAGRGFMECGSSAFA